MSANGRVTWSDIHSLAPTVFLHDELARPPMFARRLWAAITAAKLNGYRTDVERSEVMSLLLTEALIFQEFRERVGFRGTMFCPQSAANYLGIQPVHIAAILDANNIGPTTGEDFKDVLTLDLINRDCVADAIMNHIGAHDEVFQLMAFPSGLTRDQRKMSLRELLTDFDNRWLTEGLSLCRNGAAPNWQAGFSFIEGGFERTYSYTELKQQ